MYTWNMRNLVIHIPVYMIITVSRFLIICMIPQHVCSGFNVSILSPVMDNKINNIVFLVLLTIYHVTSADDALAHITENAHKLGSGVFTCLMILFFLLGYSSYHIQVSKN